MRNLLNQHGKWLLINAIVWCIAKELFLAIKIWGIENTEVQRFQFPLWPLFIVIGITGLIDGILFGTMDILFDRYFKGLKFGMRIMMKTVLNMLVGIFISTILIPFMLRLISGASITVLTGNVYTAQLIILGVYFLLITHVVQFLKLTLSWMKTQDIIDIIAHPHGMEEDRIFLFLDMKSSTSLAEHLKTSEYSQLLQECFNDMAGTAKSTHAEIYQYVGDEAVLTWKESKENYINAVMFYFRFRDQLILRAPMYYHRFKVVPEFKAGIHYGTVIKAQVGLLHKEIAYHGDAINTASRIQSKCTELKRDLLVSESFRDKVASLFDCNWEGKYPIRGKKAEMNLYSILKVDYDQYVRKENPGFLKRSTEVLFFFCRQSISHFVK